ncbi:sigma-70 family RNA polymerase sigma factor [Actinospica robiniae]|uniref:sigma-70 family RNA polymerase sigma factor n=1 Tax=Actinospica robiniae TaxID=304901 RepID=UPI00042A14C7|nr:sigma-70 family RNA polymerase sigma factor [Actinospica robiniae]
MTGTEEAGTTAGAARDRLVAAHLHLVEQEAAQYRTWRLDRADLHQAGAVGLLIAASRFDPQRAVPFGAYARIWVRKEIQRAIARQEFPMVLPPDLVGRTVVLRRALDENADRLTLAAAALGVSPGTAAALHRQLSAVSIDADEDLFAPGFAMPFADGGPTPETAVVAADFADVIRLALTRMDARRAAALVLRYGLDGGPERSFREIGRQLEVSGHTARTYVEQAQTQLRRLAE